MTSMPYEGDCALPRPPTSVTAAAGVGLLLAATVAGELVDHPSPAAGLLALDVAIGVLGCALMPLLLRRPVLGCALTAVLVTISPAVTPPAATAVLHAGTYLRFRLAAAAAAVVVASQLVRIGWRPVTVRLGGGTGRRRPRGVVGLGGAHPGEARTGRFFA